MREFALRLKELDTARQGIATLESMSPDELAMTIRSVTGRGHLAVKGRLGARIYAGEAGPYSHSVEIGFEIDPSLLAKLRTQFEEWSG